ncbi:hypothetical protein MTR_1g114390 [Medicago truncatula]|uniref:Uncharacterized protein n=1 Tax=Medicago truncatula TaxID=3880 RepID=G7IE93_MEDTR|nr:hypothetical protein MTR_1g114390 [Medicago truncatula]
MMSWFTQPPPVSISQAIQKFLSTQIENDEMHGIGKAREKVHTVVLKGYMCGLKSQSHNNPFKCAIIELQ